MLAWWCKKAGLDPGGVWVQIIPSMHLLCGFRQSIMSRCLGFLTCKVGIMGVSARARAMLTGPQGDQAVPALLSFSCSWEPRIFRVRPDCSHSARYGP